MNEEALKDLISKLKSFDKTEIDAIVKHMQVESFKKGTTILKQGQPCNNCYFVLSGCVRQYQIIDGEERTTAFFTEGQAAVLYSSYLNNLPSPYYLSCVEDCVLTVGSREREKLLHQQYPKLEFLVHRLMAHDYPKIQERLASLVNNNPEERYQVLMETQPELLNRVPLHQIASYIGVTPESFSRIRKRILEKERTKN